MSWFSALLAFVVCHVVGDVLLQTDWQALHKVRGLGDPVARRALVRHVSIYTAAFLPALVWIGRDTSAGRAVAVGAAVAIPHLVVDDGHLVRAWIRHIKQAQDPPLALTIAVDQSFHLLCLFGAALVAAS